jgi:glycosyltransferase involved in cell wall biosynthesis
MAVPHPVMPGPRPVHQRSSPVSVVTVLPPPPRELPTSRPAADLEVVIPALNEASRLPRTLCRTVEFLHEQPWSSRILVVDNGSCDGTADAVTAVLAAIGGSVPVTVVGCSRPGKGAAVRRGLLSSRSRYVGFFDADLATPVETMATAMAALQAGATAVIGSRRVPGAQLVRAQPVARRLGGATFRLLTTSLVKNVQDTQCGFKFFERRALTRALSRCRITGFAFDVELLHQLQRDGERIVEVPVVWSDAKGSSFRALRDGPPAFRSVLHMQQRPGWPAC